MYKGRKEMVSQTVFTRGKANVERTKIDGMTKPNFNQ
jgi:hypothetical protein